MPFISRKTIDEVQNRLDAVATVGEYVRLESRGNNYWGLCPFHNEKTPSFSVNPDKKTYYCFGCNKGGGIINFVEEVEKISFPETVSLLAKKTGVRIEYENTGGSYKQEEDPGKKKDELYEIYRRVAGSFHYILMSSAEGRVALDYVLKRGISRETIERFKLGYAPADRLWLYGFLRKRGYSGEFLLKSGLFSAKYPESAFFHSRLIFPINDRQGHTVAFGGRILELGNGEARSGNSVLPESSPDSPGISNLNSPLPVPTSPMPAAGNTKTGSPKYINSRESLVYKKRETLFALDAALPEIRRTKTVILCEGYMDVIALHQAGVTNAVAPLGTAFTEEQARFLRRWADNAVLAFDSDSAGQNAALKGVITCRKSGLGVYLINTEGEAMENETEQGSRRTSPLKDPADILKEKGEKHLSDFVKNVITDVDFIIAKSKKEFLSASGQAGTARGVSGQSGAGNSRSMAKAIEFMRPFFNCMDSELDGIAFCRLVSDNFGLSPDAVLNEFKKQKTRTSNLGRVSMTAGSRPFVMNEELFLLCAVALNCEKEPELFDKLRNIIPKEEFENVPAKNIYIALEEAYREGSLYLETVLSKLEDTALREFIVQKSAGREFSGDVKKITDDGIKAVKIRKLINKQQKIISEIRLAKNSGADTGDLLSEKTLVDSELQALKL